MTQAINPYVAGVPLRGERGFFGRLDTLEWVARELRNPATNALVLFGQRRIGKTTLLLQLQRTLPADAFLPVYFDLQDQATRPLGQVLADLADTVAEKVGLKPPNPDDFNDQGRSFIRAFLPQLYQVLEQGCRPIFLLDEFDVLDQVAEAELPGAAAAKALFPFLRQVMTEDLHLAFVFAVGRRAEDLSLDSTATFKASLVREVWVLDCESAEALVRQAEANGTLSFTDQAVARILSFTNCHPYLTQLLCQRIWERAYARCPTAPPCIDVLEVEAAPPDALEAGDQALFWLWNGLSPAEKIYAAALAESASEGETISENQVNQVLTAHAARLRTREVELAPRDLVKRRVLEVAAEWEYRFAVELFRRWVRRHKPLYDVKHELDRIEPWAEQLFDIGLRSFYQHQWGESVVLFQHALARNPRHFRARLYLGEALLELGQVDSAVAELERAYRLDQDEAHYALARALVTQAQVLERKGDTDGALMACERALQISPNERAAQEMRDAIRARQRWQVLAVLEGHTGSVKSVAFSPDGAMLASVSVDGTVRLWRVRDGVLLRTLEGHTGLLSSVAFSPEGTMLASGSDDKMVRLWQVNRGDLIRVLEGHTGSVIGLTFSSDGATLASASEDSMVRLWRVDDGGVLRATLTKHTDLVWCVAFSPDGTTLASGWLDETVRLSRVEDGVLLRTLTGHTGLVWSLAFSPDGMTLASGAVDKTVRLWRVDNGALLRTLTGHTWSVTSLAFSPDGAILASGSDDATVRLWRLSDGALLDTLKGRMNRVVSLAFSPDGMTLALGSGEDGTVWLWGVR